jgi:hypothetical protein
MIVLEDAVLSAVKEIVPHAMRGVFSLLFRKRHKRGGARQAHPSDPDSIPERQQLFHIGYDMMLKGSLIQRRRGVVRQFGVTVNGSTRLVTSGDTVDLDTYHALLAAGAIRPIAPEPRSAPSKASAVVDCTSVERVEE